MLRRKFLQCLKLTFKKTKILSYLPTPMNKDWRIFSSFSFSRFLDTRSIYLPPFFNTMLLAWIVLPYTDHSCIDEHRINHNVDFQFLINIQELVWIISKHKQSCTEDVHICILLISKMINDTSQAVFFFQIVENIRCFHLFSPPPPLREIKNNLYRWTSYQSDPAFKF